MAAQSTYVFISYSTIDSKVAEAIAAHLDGLGLGYFLDKKEIQWGDSIEGKIRKHIQDSSHLVVIVSPASVQSPWVPYEVGQARALGKVLLPYLTHPSINLPSFLANLRYLTDMDGVRRFFETLPAVKTKRGKRQGQRLPPHASGKVAADEAQAPPDVTAYADQRAADLPKLIRSARRAIDILAVTLESRSELVDELGEALRRNSDLRLRVLLLDPDSEYTSARASQLSFVRREFRDEARRMVEVIVRVVGDYPDRAELRLYDALPTQMSFRFDDILVLSVYSSVRLSEHVLHLQITPGPVQETFRQEFEILWAQASVPPHRSSGRGA